MKSLPRNLFLIAIFFVGSIGHARVKVSQTKPLDLPKAIATPQNTIEVLNAVVPPLHLAGQDPDLIALNVADNSLRYLWNNTSIKNTAVGAFAQRVEQVVKVEAVIQSNPQDNEKENLINTGSASDKKANGSQIDLIENTDLTDKPIEHKFQFDIKGLQALAQLKYSGWVNAALQYSLKSTEATAEISEKVFTDKDLVVSQVISNSSPRSQISIRWDW